MKFCKKAFLKIKHLRNFMLFCLHVASSSKYLLNSHMFCLLPQTAVVALFSFNYSGSFSDNELELATHPQQIGSSILISFSKSVMCNANSFLLCHLYP